MVQAMSRRIGSAVCGLRQTIMISAPARASRVTASSPTPMVEPLTTHTVPCIEVGGLLHGPPAGEKLKLLVKLIVIVHCGKRSLPSAL